MLKIRFILYFCVVMVLTAWGSERAVVAAANTSPVPAEDFQVLASGPIHEAFAEAVVLDPEPGIIAPKTPPALIEEIAPEQKPEGDVQWIPGYWAWDDERNEYIWVSGIWRVPPPNRQWMPGYWNLVTNGYQWVSGYWTGVTVQVAEYLPEPPESVEVGPSSNAPSPDHIWIPGCWLWQGGRYLWRPGYWAAAYPDWVWVPAHYSWTPRGYLFVSGYWDLTVVHRGILFAPVFFPPRVHLGLAFSFSPGFMISLNVFDDALFLRPRYGHYYYGDYYAPHHYRRGIYPWFSLHARRVGYDPIYAHQRWRNRNDHEWERRLETRFRERRDYVGPRPPQSFDHRTKPDKAGWVTGSLWSNSVMAIDHAEKTKAGVNRFKPLSQKERNEFTQREKEVRAYQQERQIRESRTQKQPDEKVLKKPEPGKEKVSKSPVIVKSGPKNGQPVRETPRQKQPDEKALKKPEPNKEKFSKSPIIDRSNQKADRKKPPTQVQAPKPNPNVEPLQRGNGWLRPGVKSQETGTIKQKSGVANPQSTGNIQRVQKPDNKQQQENNGREEGPKR